MKKLILCALGISSFAFGQTSDMVSLGNGYANDCYYSLENDEQANISATDWDLAFEMGGMATGVRLNERRATLWVYPGSINDWASLDTAGHSSWTQLRNGYDSWSNGAFNDDVATGATYGWGEYTGGPLHNVEGTKIFLIKLSDNSYRKLKIDLTSTSSIFQATHDFLDNSDETVTQITISDYAGKNFVYYNIETETVIDREPLSSNWDILFANYVYDLGGGYYGGATGVLHNKNTSTSEVSGVPTATSTYGTFEDPLATIGHDWKSYSGGAYTIVADLSYFVKTSGGDIWKIVFTDFEGSSQGGNIYFTKEKVETAGIATYEGANISVYPNPANDVLTISTTQEIQSLSIVDLSGQVVKEINTIGFSTTQVSTEDLKNGVYFVQILDASDRAGTKKIIIQH